MDGLPTAQESAVSPDYGGKKRYIFKSYSSLSLSLTCSLPLPPRPCLYLFLFSPPLPPASSTRSSCHPLSGECSCSPGWTGLYCNESCPSGYYGDSCRSTCACAQGTECHSVTGSCVCPAGLMVSDTLWLQCFNQRCHVALSFFSLLSVD